MKTAPPRHHESGFTIIELIMVIVLIGILSVSARSLFFSRDSYAGFLARDQLISAVLLAQQQALGMSGDDDYCDHPVELVVANTGENWTFTVSKSGALTTYASTQESGASTLTIDGDDLLDGTSRSFIWNQQGNLADEATCQQVNGTTELLFTGEYTWRACLSASGYVWASDGACP